MSELPPTPSDQDADHGFWTKGRVRLAVVAIALICLLIAAVVVSRMPTICCEIFPEIMDIL